MVAEVRYFFYPPMKHRWFRLGPTGFSPHHNARFTPDLCGRSIGHPETMRADRCRSKMFYRFIRASMDFVPTRRLDWDRSDQFMRPTIIHRI